MYHSIDFFDTYSSKNTYDSWKLIPTKRPVISPPDPKTTYVDIPGSDGQLDLSEVVSKRPVYNQRKGSFTFKVLNDYAGYEGWVDIYQKILNYLHGKKKKMILEDDPNYYYEGRFSVKSWSSDKDNSSINIDYNVDPFKYSVVPFTNTYSFVQSRTIVLTEEETGCATIIPTFVVSAVSDKISIKCTNSIGTVITKEFSSGTYTDKDYQFTGGNTTLRFVGNGSVTVIFTEGRL